MLRIGRIVAAEVTHDPVREFPALHPSRCVGRRPSGVRRRSLRRAAVLPRLAKHGCDRPLDSEISSRKAWARHPRGVLRTLAPP